MKFLVSMLPFKPLFASVSTQMTRNVFLQSIFHAPARRRSCKLRQVHLSSLQAFHSTELLSQISLVCSPHDLDRALGARCPTAQPAASTGACCEILFSRPPTHLYKGTSALVDESNNIVFALFCQAAANALPACARELHVFARLG